MPSGVVKTRRLVRETLRSAVSPRRPAGGPGMIRGAFGVLLFLAWAVSSVAADRMWAEPADIASRDLFYGTGGKDHQPHATFSFIKEDFHGSNPTSYVRDANGVEWRVKLGVEARPEIVASRLLWAVGYFTTEDYFLHDFRAADMLRLKRGRKLVGPDGAFHDVSLKRHSGEKKIGYWRWRENSFTGTREFNGLRVMMALINNWDLKDVNNAVYQHGKERIFLVSDLGASFATPGRSFPRDKAKTTSRSIGVRASSTPSTVTRWILTLLRARRLST